MLKRRLHRLVRVYTCQNATLLEISCYGSLIFPQIIDKYESMEREHKLLHETVNAAENKLYDTRTEVVDLTR